MKKILAMLLSAAMVTGLSMPAMAEPVDQNIVESNVIMKESGINETESISMYRTFNGSVQFDSWSEIPDDVCSTSSCTTIEDWKKHMKENFDPTLFDDLASLVQSGYYMLKDYQKEEIQNKVDEITEGITDESAKAKAIYAWVIKNVAYNFCADDWPEQDGADRIYYTFKNGKGVCGHYADLLMVMMQMAHIPCVQLSGPEHVWNALYVDNEWIMVDATNDSMNLYYGPGDERNVLGMDGGWDFYDCSFPQHTVPTCIDWWNSIENYNIETTTNPEMSIDGWTVPWYEEENAYMYYLLPDELEENVEFGAQCSLNSDQTYHICKYSDGGSNFCLKIFSDWNDYAFANGAIDVYVVDQISIANKNAVEVDVKDQDHFDLYFQGKKLTLDQDYTFSKNETAKTITVTGIGDYKDTYTFDYKDAPDHEHTWNEGEVTFPATCVAKGVKTYTCTICGATKTEMIDVLPYGFAEEDGAQVYYVKGIRQTTTEVIRIDGIWYNLVNGVVTPNTVAKNSNGWWYIDENGKVDFNYYGFADNANGTWYIQQGKVNFSASGVLKGTYNGESKWGNFKGGKLQKAETVAKNSAGWWYIGSDGFVDFQADTIARNSLGWWMIENGKVNFRFTGIASNKNGYYKVTNGKVTFKDNGIVHVPVKRCHENEPTWMQHTSSCWYYLVNSKVIQGPTVQKNSAGWWYVDKSGTVDFSFTGIASNNNGSWYCKGGKVQFGYTGNVTYNGKIYNIVNGKVK